MTGLHAVTQELGQTLEPLDSAVVALAESGRLRGLDDELGATPLEAVGYRTEVQALEASLRMARDYTGSLSRDPADKWS